MEKGIEEEEENLYKQTDEVANNILDSLREIEPNNHEIVPAKNSEEKNAVLYKDREIDYDKLFNILYQAFLKALNSCKLTLDEDGFVKIVKDELYKVV